MKTADSQYQMGPISVEVKNIDGMIRVTTSIQARTCVTNNRDGSITFTQRMLCPGNLWVTINKITVLKPHNEAQNLP